jgi:hypothetical protein
MGCVWQSEYAPEPKFGDVRVLYRASARHRKPPVWRRVAMTFGPLLVLTAVRHRVRWDPGRLAPLARWR